MAALTLPELRDAVWRANLALAEAGLVTLSFGNVSGLDPASGVLLIKPSGVPYAELRPEQLVAVAIKNGRVIGATFARRRTRRPKSRSIAVTRRSAASSIRTRPRPRAGPRRAGRSRLSARPTPTTSAVRSR
jgi:hypothetical protein